MNALHQFTKNKGLRIVNIFGLSVIFACILVSYGYVKEEASYDRYNKYADRIVRLTLQYDNDPVDGRTWGNGLDNVLLQIPEVEQVVRLSGKGKELLTCQGEHHIVDNALHVSSNFFDVFSIPLVEGERESVFRSPMKDVAISEEFARTIFGSEQAMGKELYVNLSDSTGYSLFVTGVFNKIPETSHFHSDLLIYQPDEGFGFNYTYLLLKEEVQLDKLEQKITHDIANLGPDEVSMRALLMPITDIHLHSRNLRELEPNGNIYFIYLIIGANILLLIIVLFNLWLNSSLIFSYRRRYYGLLRLNGAATADILEQESWQSLILAACAFIVGNILVFLILLTGFFEWNISFPEAVIISATLLLLIMSISLIPALSGLSSGLLLNTRLEIKPVKFSYKNVKYMLMAQYAIVMLVVIVSFGIVKQMNLVKETQAGGNDRNVLVLREQPNQVVKNYEVLRTELLKHNQVKSVTACFQVPGDAIRDHVKVTSAGNETVSIPLIIIAEDFLPFFHIQTVAGKKITPDRITYDESMQIYDDFFIAGKKSAHQVECMINLKALERLGYTSPEEAVGQTLKFEGGALSHLNTGTICGVTDDFYYTSMHESTIPLIIMQMPIFNYCFFIKIDPTQTSTAIEIVNDVWQNVNPDVPINYTFMQDIFHNTYRNELNAERLVLIFSLLCLIIATLGLIIFMAFIIKRRTKEIGIRKINGAKNRQIIMLLNVNYLRWIMLAFIIAVPATYFILQSWLDNFAYKIQLSWWIFVLAALVVLLISIISVSWQSLRAATTNPADTVKSE